VGDVLLDVLLKETADRGATLAVEPGGSAANTAAWLVWCGVPATLVGAVGADAAGDLLSLDLRRRGVVPALMVLPAARSGAFLARLTASSYQHLATDRGANDLIAWGPQQTATLGRACHLHLSGYLLAHATSSAAAVAAAQAARAAGLGVSLDLGAPHALRAAAATLPALLGEMAPDLLFANEEEAITMLDLLDGRPGVAAPGLPPVVPAAPVGWNVHDILMSLLRWAPVVVLKRGVQGSSAAARAWNDVMLHQPPPAVPVVDTVGAGDAFVAGFLSAWRNHPADQPASPDGPTSARRALSRATEVAGVCLGAVGGRPGHATSGLVAT
jgi:sugar/nucleoside kinase (ribokinase family)